MILDRKVIIIAEIGECFNGDMQVAEKLIEAAADAGCDYAKFQTLDYATIREDDPEKEWFFKIALNPEKIERLVDLGKKYKIQTLFSPENCKTATWLIDAGLTEVKIASNCLVDLEMREYIKNNFTTVFCSTGMATLEEINSAINDLDVVDDLFVLHCVSEYPTGPLLDKRGLKPMDVEDAKLSMMKMLINLYPDMKIGYSDHTVDPFVPALAVAAGAKVVEKHITLDRKKPIDNYHNGKEYLGTDHVLSIEPGELKEMARLIRLAEKTLGDWRWDRSDGEKLLIDFMRGRFSED